jgi:hypothetical protein
MTGRTRFAVTGRTRFIGLKRITPEVVDVLNVLMWKMGKPQGCETPDDVGHYVAQELYDKGWYGVTWCPKLQKLIIA